MIKEHDCSVPPPLPSSTSDDRETGRASSGSLAYSSRDLESHSRSPDSSRHCLEPPEPGLVTSSSSDAKTYFFHFVGLHSLFQGILEGLYAPDSKHVKWAEIQRRIRKLDEQLSHWTATLPDFLEPKTHSHDPQTEPFRIALAIMSHSTRVLINRPCLCRIDRRIANQSEESVRKNREAANKCVSSAQMVITYLPSKHDPRLLRWSPIWWMLLHHIARATTVLLLELSYRAEHMPSEAEEILQDAKKAVSWLHSLAYSNAAAYRFWVTLSNLLRLAAQRVGGSTDDIATAESEEHLFNAIFASTVETTSAHYVPPNSAIFDPTAWDPMNPMNLFEHGGHYIPGDVPMGGLDHYDFYQQYGEQNLFPSASEINRMAVEQHHLRDDQGLLQSPNGDMWSGLI